MKPERAFVAERPAAQHCAELVRGAEPSAEVLLPRLAAIGEPLARALAAALAPLTGGEAPQVRCGELRQSTPLELTKDIAPLAANCLLAAGAPDTALLLSIEARAVLSLIDRAFGGRGEAPAKLPDAFPLSAELLIVRLEALAAAAIAKATGTAARLDPLRRDSSLERLAPFTEGTALALIPIEVEKVGGGAWHMTLAVPHETLPALLGDRKHPAASRPEAANACDPLTGPFGDMPLTLSAVLVDMRIPVSALASLAPGQVIPVAVARSIPIKIGGSTVAHGTVGAMDERVAVQIAQAF